MSIFTNETPAPAPSGSVLVATVFDPIKVAIIRSILEAEEIPYLVKERGVGSSLSIIMGANFLGTDIYVPETCYDKAMELLEPLFPEEDEELEGNLEDELEEDYPEDGSEEL